MRELFHQASTEVSPEQTSLPISSDMLPLAQYCLLASDQLRAKKGQQANPGTTVDKDAEILTDTRGIRSPICPISS